MICFKVSNQWYTLIAQQSCALGSTKMFDFNYPYSKKNKVWVHFSYRRSTKDNEIYLVLKISKKH